MESGRKQFPLTGQVVGENFLVGDAIGEGPITTVYFGKDRNWNQAGVQTNEIVKIKALNRQHAPLRENFQALVGEHIKLKHKNILDWQCQSGGEDPCVVVQHIKAITLADLIESIGPVEDEQELGSLLLQICDALEYAHLKQVFHGFIHPKNILLLHRDDESIEVRIDDFCMANLISADDYETACGDKPTELVYAAPERYTGGKVSFKADVYSLAAITYFMIAGKAPYNATSLSELRAVHKDPKALPPALLQENINLAGITQLNGLILEGLCNVEDWRPSLSQFQERIRSWHDSFAHEFEGLDDEDFVEDHGVEWGVAEKPVVIHSEVQNFSPSSTNPPGGNSTTSPPTGPMSNPLASPMPGSIVSGGRSSASAGGTPNSHSTGSATGHVAFTTADVNSSQRARFTTAEETPLIAQPQTKPQAVQANFEPITAQEQAKLESMVIEGAETAKKPTRRKPHRKRKMVTTTVRNLIALRQNQAEQSETAAMHFSETFSDQGTRQSPVKTLVRLFFTVVVLGIVSTLVVLNFTEIKRSFMAASLSIEPLWRKPAIEKDKVWEEAVSKAPVVPAVVTLKVDPKTHTQVKTPTYQAATAPPQRKLKPIEEKTPLASDFYSKRMFERMDLNNADPKLGNRRRIDYREFDMDWLK